MGQTQNQGGRAIVVAAFRLKSSGAFVFRCPACGRRHTHGGGGIAGDGGWRAAHCRDGEAVMVRLVEIGMVDWPRQVTGLLTELGNALLMDATGTGDPEAAAKAWADMAGNMGVFEHGEKSE